MNVLVFQHIGVEHPGSFRDFMTADGLSWHTVELDEGASIPPLQDFDGLMVMGGPMDVWHEDRHPWLAPEKQAIRRWVLELNRPFLGICLGHQLLADALGGTVGPMSAPEVGICDVVLQEPQSGPALFAGLASPLECLQWHGCEVKALPEGAELLASNDACRVQAFRAGERAFGIQFHVEVTATTVADWGDIPAYRHSLEAALGPGAQVRLEAETAQRLSGFVAAARTVYRNFRALL